LILVQLVHIPKNLQFRAKRPYSKLSKVVTT
jgi:hypothetical protein